MPGRIYFGTIKPWPVTGVQVEEKAGDEWKPIDLPPVRSQPSVMYSVDVPLDSGAEFRLCYQHAYAGTESPCSQWSEGAILVPEPGLAVTLLFGLLLLEIGRRFKCAH